MSMIGKSLAYYEITRQIGKSGKDDSETMACFEYEA